MNRETEIQGYCSICVSKCGAIYTVADDRLVKVRVDAMHPNGKAICMKGRAAPEIVHNPERLTVPMRRKNPKTDDIPQWEEISWENAMSIIAAELSRIKSHFGPEAVVVGSTTPSGPMVDSFEWVKRFAQIFGTPNFLGTTEICNWHKDDANVFTFGCPTPPGDHRNAEVILLWGHNPANTWLAQAEAIGQGRSKGAKLIVVDPRPTALAQQADLWLRVRPGTDRALAMGIANALIQLDLYDKEFVQRWTNAPLLVRLDSGLFLREQDISRGATQNRYAVWDAMRSRLDFSEAKPGAECSAIALEGVYKIKLASAEGDEYIECTTAFALYKQALAEFTVERTEEITGVSQADILSAAKILRSNQRISHYAWSGVGQHLDATQIARAIAILYALTGSFDQRGANWIFSTHPTNKLDDYEKLLPHEAKYKTLGYSQRPIGPAAKGVINFSDMCDSVLQKQPYQVKGLITFGLQFQTSNLEPEKGTNALRQLEFHAHVDLFETPSARFADILLPACSFAERSALRVGFEISEEAVEHIQLRPRLVSPRGLSRPDYDIIIDLAKRLGFGSQFFHGKIEDGWNYVLKPVGLTVEDLRRAPGGIRKPLQQVEKKYQRLQDNGDYQGFQTPTGRVEIYSEKLLCAGQPPIPSSFDNGAVNSFNEFNSYPYYLSSTKNGFFCHSQHRNIASLRKRAPYPMVDISTTLARKKDIADGDWVQIVTSTGTARFKARLNESMAQDVIVAEYGWWQECNDLGLEGYPILGTETSNYNNLISANVLDPISGSSPLRSARCDIRRDITETARSWEGFKEFQITQIIHEADGVKTVIMESADGKPVPDYLPGQHVTVQVPSVPDVIRSYSLIGRAKEPDRKSYAISVRHALAKNENGEIYEGKMSTLIHQRMKIGDAIKVKMPNGSFVLPVRSKQPIVIFAGGIGITPFISYLESLVGKAMAPEVVLYNANRNRKTQAFSERIIELQRCTPSLRVINCYDKEEEGGDISGFLTGHLVEEVLIKRRARFYLCAPELMIKNITQHLRDRGVPAFDIFREVFRSPTLPILNATQEFSVTFHRSKRTIVWKSLNGSLLTFAEQNGISMASGCRVGQCESCVTRIIKGQVAHMVGDGPEEDGMCFTCQAIPSSDITLDA
ncbi:MAG: molybdopterin-dependent oxidoreductase [Pseudomonadota bacterium]